MWYTYVYSNVIVYQKYLVTSIKIVCATRSLYASSGPKAEGSPTNNQRERRLGSCRLWGGLDKARHIILITLLVRVLCFRNGLYKAVKGPTKRSIVLSMIAISYWRRRRCFEPEKFASPLTLLRLYKRRSEWFLLIHIPEMKLHQIWTEVHSMTLRTSQTFFRSLWYLLPCVYSFEVIWRFLEWKSKTLVHVQHLAIQINCEL